MAFTVQELPRHLAYLAHWDTCPKSPRRICPSCLDPIAPELDDGPQICTCGLSSWLIENGFTDDDLASAADLVALEATR